MGKATYTTPDGRKATINYETEEQLHEAISHLENLSNNGGNTEEVEPFKYKPRVMAMPDELRSQAQRVDVTPDWVKQAAATGVDTDTGAPGHLTAGFTDNPSQYAGALRKAIENKLGYTPEYRRGPASGILEYKPEGGRWTTVNGLKDAPNLAGIMDAFFTAGGGLGGAVGGTLIGNAPGGVIGSMAGSGLGAAASSYVKHGIGKAIGTIPEQSQLNDVQGLDAAGEAVMYDAIGLGMMGVGKFAKYAVRGGTPFTVKEATELLGQQQKYSKVVDDIEKGSGVEFKPTIAQKAMSGDIRGSETAARAARAQGYAESDPDVGITLQALQNKNQKALGQYFDNMLAKSRQEGLSKEDATKNVSEALMNPYRDAYKLAKEEVAKLPQEVQEQQASSMLRGAVDAAHKEFREKIEAPAWTRYQKAIGYDEDTFSSKINVPVSPEIQSLLKQWEARNKAFKSQLKEKNTPDVVLDFELKEPEFDLDNWLKTGDTPKRAPKDVDLAVLDQKIKDLDSTLRGQLSGKIAVTAREKDLRDAVSTLKDMREEFLTKAHPEIKTLLDSANDATKQRVSRFNQGLADTLLTKDNTGGLRLTDAEGLYTLLRSKDKATLGQLADVIKGSPEAKNELNNYLFALYRKNYTARGSGIPNYNGHKQFLKDYGNVVDTFFNPADKQTLNKIGGIGELLAKEYTELSRFMPQLKRSFNGEIETINPTNVANYVVSGRMTPVQMDKAIYALKNSAYKDSTYDQWKSAVADKLHNDLFRRDGTIDVGRLQRIVDSDQLVTMQKLFNQGSTEYGNSLTTGLGTLLEAAKLVESKSIQGLNPSIQTALTDIARVTYAPPLSREGRLVSLLQRSRRVTEPQNVYRALTDPDYLKKLTYQTRDTLRKIYAITGASGMLNKEQDNAAD